MYDGNPGKIDFGSSLARGSCYRGFELSGVNCMFVKEGRKRHLQSFSEVVGPGQLCTIGFTTSLTIQCGPH